MHGATVRYMSGAIVTRHFASPAERWRWVCRQNVIILKMWSTLPTSRKAA